MPPQCTQALGLLQCPAMAWDLVVRFLAQARTRTAIGRHRLAGWPTKF